MTILSIDIGTWAMGWGVVEIYHADRGSRGAGEEYWNWGVFKIPRIRYSKSRGRSGGKEDWIRRVDDMMIRVGELLDEFKPDVVLIEQPQIFGAGGSSRGRGGRGVAAANSGSVMKLMFQCASIRQFCKMWMADRDILRDGGTGRIGKVVLCPVSKWKGNVPKSVTCRRVGKYLGGNFEVEDDNAVDALGMIVWYRGQTSRK